MSNIVDFENQIFMLRVKKLYDSGKTAEEIGKTLGLELSEVREYLDIIRKAILKSEIHK